MNSADLARPMAQAPLPMKQGVSPSRVYLAPGDWPSLMDFLAHRFPHLPREVLEARLGRGEIVDADGRPQAASHPYRPGRWLWYYREVPDEAPVPFELAVLHRDDRLVVVDKPHFLASIPGGRYLRETALTRLRSRLMLPELSPVHRLDRDTAGVMLFCTDPGSRGRYQAMFQSRDVDKEYEAVAPWRLDLVLPQVRRSRLVPREDHFTMRESPGDANSETRIDMIRRLPGSDGLALYRLRPLTGRKHQLRVHMSAAGAAIVNDGFYPVLKAFAAEDDFSRPLQLLARSIAFEDPFSGRPRRFESRRVLQVAAAAE